MWQITDPAYFLPEIQPVLFRKTFSTGANKPLLIDGVCSRTGSRSQYVVKLRAASRMGNKACGRELIASFLANELGLSVAEPVVVNITPEFADTLIGKEEFEVVKASIGKNFGCQYIPNGTTFLNEQELTNEQKGIADNILAFDIFVANPDRTISKPNMLAVDKDIIIYDHELAFSFLLALFGRKDPWLIPEADLYWIKQHYFYPAIKKNFTDFSEFILNLSKIDQNFWTRVDVFVPKEWCEDEQTERIRANLDLLISQRDIFLTELQRVMS